MSYLRRKRPIAPCIDRETFYESMAKWSFAEINQNNFDLLDWIEKTAYAHQPTLINGYGSSEMSPEMFLRLLATKNCVWLERLANHLCATISKIKRDQPSYNIFFEFARDEAELAEDCIFLEKELVGIVRNKTLEDYKSVFYTLYKLASEVRNKFGVPSLKETKKIDRAELYRQKREDREKCAQRIEVYEAMGNWSFAEIEKKNQEVWEWLTGDGKSLAEEGSEMQLSFGAIKPEKFLDHLRSHDGRSLLCKLSNSDFVGFDFYDDFYVFAKAHLPDECIFWEHELLEGNSYEDYKSVFCTIYLLVTTTVPPITNNDAMPSRNSIPNRQKQEQQESLPRQAKKLPRNKEFVIHAKALTGPPIEINCLPSQTLTQIKSKIHDKTGMPLDQMRIIFQGIELKQDGRTLKEIGLRNESIVHLALAMRGC